MFYTIYKVTNLLNEKFYIGKHVTNNLDDGYMGSGKLIKQAIKKHGIQNFSKEILFIFDNEEEMNLKERELVVVNENTYNLCDGGKGGWSYINRNDIPKFRGRKHKEESKAKMGHFGNQNCKGRTLTEEHKAKIGKALAGKPGKPKSEEHKRKISESLRNRNRR